MTADRGSVDPTRPLVFVSYAREDLAVARRVVLAVQLLAVNVYWDQHLHGGAAVESALETAIEGAACVIVLWSEHSVISKWVQIEAAEADDRDVIVPVLVEDARVPLRYRRRQYVDLRSWSGDAGDNTAMELRHAVASTIAQVPPLSATHATRQELAEVLRSRPGRRGLNLMGADLESLDLRGAVLVGSNLVGADLRSANLEDANLDGANLECAQLTGANLTKASLRRANLWGADVSGTKGLLTADLSEANAFETGGIAPSSRRSLAFNGALHSFPDYSSLLHHYTETLGLGAAELLNQFPWLAHPYFVGLLAN